MEIYIYMSVNLKPPSYKELKAEAKMRRVFGYYKYRKTDLQKVLALKRSPSLT